MEVKSTTTEILKCIETMVDPNAPVEQQLAQMREQIAALAELPKLINEKLESVNKQISQICIQKASTKKEVVQEQIKEQRQIKSVETKKQKETQQSHQYYQMQFHKHIEEQNEKRKQQQLKQQQQQLKRQMQQQQQRQQQQQIQQQQKENNSVNPKDSLEIMELEPEEEPSIQIQVTKPSLTGEELDAVQREELRRSLEDLRMRKSASPAKDQASQTSRRELRLARGKPEPAFGPGPIERPLYLPGGKLWKMSEYDEDQITETLVGQAEVIKGHAMGVNFKKFEKPPPGVDHFKHSEVYRAVHNMEDAPLKKVQMLRPTAFAESEIRERVQSMSPANLAETRYSGAQWRSVCDATEEPLLRDRLNQRPQLFI